MSTTVAAIAVFAAGFAAGAFFGAVACVIVFVRGVCMYQPDSRDDIFSSEKSQGFGNMSRRIVHSVGEKPVGGAGRSKPPNLGGKE